MKKFLFLICTLCLSVLSTQAQDTWSLEKCIEYAQQQNLSIKQTLLNIDNEKVSLEQNKNSRFPIVNASSNVGVNLGRSVNYATNSISTQTVLQHTLGINSSVAIYQGGRVKYAIEQNQINIKANELDVQQTRENIALQVAQAYLQVIKTQEQLKLTETQLEQSKNQVTRMDKLIRAGALPKGDKLELEAQIANNERFVAEAKNAVEMAYLSLKQLMAMDLTDEIQVEIPNVTLDESLINTIDLNAIYEQALGTQPSILAGEMRLKSAELSKDIARAGKLPTITLSAGLNTAYSSAAKTPKAGATTLDTVNFPLVVNSVPVDAKTIQPNTVINYENTGYFKQFFDQNLGGSFNVGISYPIWDNYSAKLQEERAELQKVGQQLQNEQTKQQLKMDIQNAYISAIAAKNTYVSSQKSLTAQQLSFKNIEKKFNIGTANPFELNNARNTLLQSEISLTQAKYDYIFRLKILDFYAGNPIQL